MPLRPSLKPCNHQLSYENHPAAEDLNPKENHNSDDSNDAEPAGEPTANGRYEVTRLTLAHV